jgi:hypothetical protein
VKRGGGQFIRLEIVEHVHWMGRDEMTEAKRTDENETKKENK